MATRLFYQISTGKYLNRIDHNPTQLDNDAKVSCSSAFAIPPTDIKVFYTDALSQEERELQLPGAVDWIGTPPEIPQSSQVYTGKLIKPITSAPPDPTIAILLAAADVVTEIDKAFSARSTKLTNTEKEVMKDKMVTLIAKAQGR